jgi:N-acetylneuraminic acid mutarotase
MSSAHPFVLFTVGTLCLAGCNDDTPLTQPEVAAPARSSAVAAALAPNTWVPRAAMPEGRVEFALAAAPNSPGRWFAYTFGGFFDGFLGNCSTFSTMIYDVDRNIWRLASPFVQRSFANGAAKVGGRLYFTGGSSGCTGNPTYNDTYAYDPRTGRTTQKADLPRATTGGVSAEIGGMLYVLAGYCSGQVTDPGHCTVGGPVRQFYRYDPSTDSWAARRQPSHFHGFGAAGVIDGKLYVVGGNREAPDLDVYTPATNTWRTLAPFPVARGRYAAAPLKTELFVLAWGNNAPDGEVTPVAYSYNPATNTWRPRAIPPASGPIVRVVLDGEARLFLPGVKASYLYTP